MDLEQHLHLIQPRLGERYGHARHRALDEVGAGALDRRVDRRAFAALAFVLVRRLDAREPGLPAEQGLRIAALARALERALDIVGDAGEALEIAADQRLRLVGRDFEPARKPPARNAVEDREIDRLRLGAGVAIDLAEQFDRGRGVNVLPLRERLLEFGDIGHMRREPQLDLAIVGGDQHMARRGDEGIADLAADLAADRDILQIGIGRRQPPGLRADEAVAGMDAPGLRIDLLLQRVGIGRLEFGELPPFEDHARDRHAVAFEALELVLVGRPVARLALAPALEAELVEQYLTELLGTADGEGLSCLGMDRGFHPRHFLREFARQARQIIAVDHDARALHRLDDAGKRSVDHLVDAGAAFERQAQLEQPPQSQRDIGILGGIFGRAGERDFGEADLRFAGAAHLLERQADMVEMQLCQLVEAVTMLARVEREAHQQRVVIGRDADAMLRQHADIIFQIMPDLQHRVVGEQRADPRDGVGHRNLVGLFGEHVSAAMAERDVAGLPRRDRHADADKLAGDAVETRRFGIDRNHMRRLCRRDPAVERVEVGHAFIGCPVDCRHGGQHRRRRAGRRRRSGRGAGARQRGRPTGGDAVVELGGKRAKAMFVEKQLERRRRNRVELQTVERVGQRAIALQIDQHARQFGHRPMLDQIFAQLRRLHRLGPVERRGQIAIFLDQLGRGLGSDPAHAGHIVDAVAHQREHVADEVGGDAELLMHRVDPQPDILHRVEHVDMRSVRGFADQLHQILVAADDGHVPPFAHRGLGIGGDQIVGLIPLHLNARQRKGARRVADQRELRAQIFGRLGTVRLILIVNLVTERLARMIEDDRKVRRSVRVVQILRELPEHRGVAIDRTDRHPVRVRQRRQAMIGAEDVAGAIDQIEMILL